MLAIIILFLLNNITYIYIIIMFVFIFHYTSNVIFCSDISYINLLLHNNNKHILIVYNWYFSYMWIIA